ncbi:Uncharacterized protein DAT39_006806 [Clarias magur]|uniref:Uncharacterized protein n=1 Tax=Clarias magur TaxID=1594786 RepID=A0A8J4UCC7_CLAMG|nr:Uncharacterized protein DAT39_006806 [Clarias magur]
MLEIGSYMEQSSTSSLDTQMGVCTASMDTLSISSSTLFYECLMDRGAFYSYNGLMVPVE